jgi:hypothetical protein
MQNETWTDYLARGLVILLGVLLGAVVLVTLIGTVQLLSIVMNGG